MFDRAAAVATAVATLYDSLMIRLHLLCAVALVFLAVSMVHLNAAPTVSSVIAGDELGKVFTSTNPTPDYPIEARKNNWSGSGVFRALVDPSGKVTEVQVVRRTGHRVMDEAVTKAVIKWKANRGPSREVEFPVEFQAPRKRPAGRG